MNGGTPILMHCCWSCWRRAILKVRLIRYNNRATIDLQSKRLYSSHSFVSQSISPLIWNWMSFIHYLLMLMSGQGFKHTLYTNINTLRGLHWYFLFKTSSQSYQNNQIHILTECSKALYSYSSNQKWLEELRSSYCFIYPMLKLNIQ